MKFSLFILSAVFFTASCNSKPKVTDTTTIQTTDSTIADQATINELEEKEATQAITPVAKKKSSTNQTSGSNTATNNTEAMSTETGNSAKANTGWSKTAKGAVIGGVVGAGSGAVINKKNRAAGAVVGGVVGAGAGAIIGNEADKKDGRH